jgi:hypothetical protein
MPDGLTSAQRVLATEVVLRRGADPQLLAALERHDLSGDERKTLGDLATVDLAESGFDGDYAPTDLGRRLEELIDALNAPG